MKQEMTYEEKHKWMTEAPIDKLILKLAIPTIISMLVTSIYNMADTYFVSQINTSASAAVGVNFSIMAMIQAIGFTLGLGSGNYMSRMLGAGEREKAQKACSSAFYLSLILGILLTVAGILNVEKLVYFLGATKTIAPYAMDYARFILVATPYMTASFVLNNHLRAQGNATQSMIGITVGGILNIILDPILIFGFDMGISGAAIATIFSQFISFLILLVLIIRTESVLKPEIKYFSGEGWVYKEIMYAGMPSLGRQGLASISSILLNVTASGYGDAAVAAMSIVTRITMFIYSGLIGFGQGFQPVCGFNYGAKRFDRVRESYFFCLKVAVVVLSLLGIIFFVGAGPVMALFRADDKEVIEIGAMALRCQCVMLPCLAGVIIGNMLTQSIGYGFRATLIAIGRQGLFYIPSMILLPKIIGLGGLQVAQAVADGCTFFMTMVIVYFVLREIKEMEQKEALH